MDNVIQNIRIEDIVPNDYHHQYNTKEIEELVTSIKRHGILEPITLRPKGNKYELILGNKRYEAAKIVGLESIPAIIKKIDDNVAKEYLTINNDTLVLNNISLSASNENNLDVINLSKLNEEYERDELKMNTNQFDNNNITQPTNNINPQNAPTFGGRFFPSLEDEPTNMNFSNNSFPTPNQEPQPTNNFIDLTDLNIGNQPSTMPQANYNEEQAFNPQFNTPMPNLDVQPMNQTPLNDNNNIINLESLKQNPEMGTQPIAPGINIDNNFQDVINDFHPNNSMMPNGLEPQPMGDPIGMNSTISPISNIDPMMSQPYGMPQDIPSPIVEPQPLNNQEFMQPTYVNPMAEPIMTNMEPVMATPEMPQPGLAPQLTSKDVLPVINTLKATAVNLENFGYTIRITDEDLPTSYKITIEVDK